MSFCRYEKPNLNADFKNLKDKKNKPVERQFIQAFDNRKAIKKLNPYIKIIGKKA